MITKEQLVEQFKQHFDGEPRVFQAPGRINLIGEHTDYNDGYILLATIDRYVYVAITRRNDHLLNLWSDKFKEEIGYNLNTHTLSRRGHWSDYVSGILLALQASGVVFNGADIFITSDIPPRAGMATSAAMEAALAYGIALTHEKNIKLDEVVKICQKAESDLLGQRSGVIDQLVVTNGKAGHALHVDCRTQEIIKIPMPMDSFRIVLCNTMVKHDSGNTEFNRRKSECHQGVRLLKKYYPRTRALRDISTHQFKTGSKRLPNIVRKRCNHVITENERVKLSVTALQKNDLAAMGKQMFASHSSLQRDFQVTSAELDLLVSIALKSEGVYGACMTGEGFGGCTVNLVELDKIETFSQAVRQQFTEEMKYEPEIYVCVSSDGVKEIF